MAALTRFLAVQGGENVTVALFTVQTVNSLNVLLKCSNRFDLSCTVKHCHTFVRTPSSYVMFICVGHFNSEVISHNGAIKLLMILSSIQKSLVTVFPITSVHFVFREQRLQRG